VVERYRPDVACAAVPGDARNIKVTTPGDLPAAEALAATFEQGRWTDTA
jgi:2-C-methyl-D-erythritol 4-phosphate cytidylyltransferase